MILGVSGGRDYVLTPGEEDAFIAIVRALEPEEFWHGGAKGVDQQCAALVRNDLVVADTRVRAIYAPWDKLDPVGDIRFGRNDAGPLRNWWMAREARRAAPAWWIFFTGGVGTNDMLQQCRAHLIRTIDLRKPHRGYDR